MADAGRHHVRDTHTRARTGGRSAASLLDGEASSRLAGTTDITRAPETVVGRPGAGGVVGFSHEAECSCPW